MKKIILIVCLLSFIISLHAQEYKTLDRVYTPVMFSGHDTTGMAGRVKTEWTAFSYNANDKSWKTIPFQIDQVKENGGYEHVTPDSLIKNDDQILFMPSDIGDQAPLSAWAFATDDTTAARLELECADPLGPAKKGWIYLFKNVADPDTFINYMSYKPAPNYNTSAADTVISHYYKMGHMDNAVFNYLAFPSAPGVDLLDRLKIRMRGTPLPFVTVKIDENKFSANTDPVSNYRGEVRLFRDARTTLDTGLAGYTFSVPLNLAYNPYSISGSIGIDIDQSTAALLQISLIRLSLDLSPQCDGMTFYCDEHTDGTAIDGVQDNLSFANITDFNAPKWMMVTGEQGTVFMMLQWPQVDNGDTQIYHYDNKEGGALDGTGETGDNQSWSDMGIWSRSTGSNDLVASSLTFAWSLYFIDENVNDNAANFAENLLQQHRNPVSVTVTEQNYMPVQTLIASNGAKPGDFILHQAYPNPYRIGEGMIRMDFFNNHLRNNVNLIIYNVLGQQVRRFSNINIQPGARKTISWDGRDEAGYAVSPGTYFYRLSADGQQQIGKMLIIK